MRAMATVLMFVLTTGITGAKYCLLTKITGSLWMPMADHFFNNTIINLLHVITISGADELQVIRHFDPAVSIILDCSFYLLEARGTPQADISYRWIFHKSSISV